jgi:hypothetical protein
MCFVIFVLHSTFEMAGTRQKPGSQVDKPKVLNKGYLESHIDLVMMCSLLNPAPSVWI